MTDIQPTKDWLTTLVTALERHHLNIAEQIVRNYPDEVLAAIRAETAKNSGEAVGYVNRLSQPTRISPTETPELEMPVYAERKASEVVEEFITWLSEHNWRICADDYSGNWQPMIMRTETLLSMFAATPTKRAE